VPGIDLGLSRAAPARSWDINEFIKMCGLAVF